MFRERGEIKGLSAKCTNAMTNPLCSLVRHGRRQISWCSRGLLACSPVLPVRRLVL